MTILFNYIILNVLITEEVWSLVYTCHGAFNGFTSNINVDWISESKRFNVKLVGFLLNFYILFSVRIH